MHHLFSLSGFSSLICSKACATITAMNIRYVLAVSTIWLASLAVPLSSSAQSCADCHADLTADKTAHAAVAMGCESCHTAIDPTDIPHKIKNNIKKGLSAEQPDLCFSCHDKAQFSKTNAHAALSMGCTSCHNPHASKYPKLLSSPMPDICYTCHDKSAFTKKDVHPPVATGGCSTCHQPHSGDIARLLTSPVPDLCIMCHEKMSSGKHVMAGHGSGNHPLSGRPDPSRPGKELSCISCHSPHASDLATLFTGAQGYPKSICLTCHRKIMVR